MEQDEEFVFVFRSGEHGRGNNNTGLSLRIYKKSDFFWNSLNPGYNTIQSKCDPFSQSEVTLVTNRGEGHDLWLNMAPPHIHPTSPRGVTDHGFEYKHVIWDYRCITDEEVEDYLVFSFGEALGEAAAAAHIAVQPVLPQSPPQLDPQGPKTDKRLKTI